MSEFTIEAQSEFIINKADITSDRLYFPIPKSNSIHKKRFKTKNKIRVRNKQKYV